MEWAHILAYVTGTVDQQLLLRNEYLVAENRILKAQLHGPSAALGCRASEARRDRVSTGPQGSERGGDRCLTGDHPGVVPKARRSQIRWITSASTPGSAANRQRSRGIDCGDGQGQPVLGL
jgi:hypothetical protein